MWLLSHRHIFFLFGLQEDSGDEATGKTGLSCGRSIVAAGYALYGSATMIVISIGREVNGFMLDPVSIFLDTRAELNIHFCFVTLTGNRRVCLDRSWHEDQGSRKDLLCQWRIRSFMGSVDSRLRQQQKVSQGKDTLTPFTWWPTLWESRKKERWNKEKDTRVILMTKTILLTYFLYTPFMFFPTLTFCVWNSEWKDICRSLRGIHGCRCPSYPQVWRTLHVSFYERSSFRKVASSLRRKPNGFHRWKGWRFGFDWKASHPGCRTQNNPWPNPRLLGIKGRCARSLVFYEMSFLLRSLKLVSGHATKSPSFLK